MTITNQIYIQRHGLYEKRFARSFYLVILRAQRQIVRNLLNGTDLEQVDIRPLQGMYNRLYMDIMRKEGAWIWNLMVAPIRGFEVQQKDLFDDLAQIMQADNSTELLAMWNGLMNGFLTYYVGQRILEVMGTTIRQAQEKIQTGREQGLTDKEIARIILADNRARELRANTIARTETTTAINKSWLLALESSKIPWEKSWNAIRDDRTRDSHWNTDPAFWIDIRDSFLVGGFPMAYPGDSTQGAPVGLLVNCRCMLKFRIRGQRVGFRPKM